MPGPRVHLQPTDDLHRIRTRHRNDGSQGRSHEHLRVERLRHAGDGGRDAEVPRLCHGGLQRIRRNELRPEVHQHPQRGSDFPDAPRHPRHEEDPHRDHGPDRPASGRRPQRRAETVEVGVRQPRPRHADPLPAVPPGLQDDGVPLDSRGDAREALRRREGGRPEVRLHRERLGPSARAHLLSGMRRRRDQTVRIRHHGLVPRQGQQVQEVRIPARDFWPARTDREGEPVLQRALPPLSSRDTLIFGGPSSRVAKPHLEARIRPARPSDFAACARLCLASLRDLSRRNLLRFSRHALTTDPDGFHVAIVRGRIVCYAITILRGKTHFLAQFFGEPGMQSRGIGRQVLARAFDAPRPPRGTIRCVVASLDLRAQALYTKFGMLPRTIMYFVEGKPTQSADGIVELRQLGPAGVSTKQARDLAARFDRRLREARRDADQRYFVTVAKGSRFYEARAGGKAVGYVVVRGNGAIGPGGVHDSSLSGGLMSAAIAKAHENGMKTVSAWVPGLNGGALMAAFGAGLKVEFLTAWMAAKDIVRLESYLPSGGVLF